MIYVLIDLEVGAYQGTSWMYLHGPRTVSDICRKFWMTSCNIPSDDVELDASAALAVVGGTADRVGMVDR